MLSSSTFEAHASKTSRSDRVIPCSPQNHAKHAVIALAGLGATDGAMDAYWKMYCAETPYGLKLDATTADTQAVATGKATEGPALDVTAASAAALTGKKKHFSWLCNFYSREVARLGTPAAVVSEYFPKLVDGLPASLTHGIIHLGWGLAAGSAWMTVEGLAYLHFAHVSVRPERFVDAVASVEDRDAPPATPYESLVAIAATRRDELKAFAAEVKADAAHRYPKETFVPELVVAGFQWEVAKVLDAGHAVFYARPAWLDDDAASDPDALVERLYEAVTLLHVVGEGNFLLLHLVTSLWGLEQTLVATRADAPARRHAYRCFWAMTLALVTTSAGGWPAADALARARDELGDAVDADDDADVAADWDNLVDSALHQVEEHNIKLVFVERELWGRFGRKTMYRRAAAAFTDTPNIGPRSIAYQA
mmetsp:Transcript_4131/g.16636  ORF Transcript_4131/g.16636 Transcript_4131/m.16636 type:complete len:423 (+) Transcript_4131:200-1468(+)